MILDIDDVLSPEQVARFRKVLQAAPWGDGRITAGYQSALVKDNHQLPETCPEGLALGEEIQNALGKHLLFQSAALPRWIMPPLFNRYGVGQKFGTHIDNAIRPVAGAPHRIRTDLSVTLFLSEPDEYDGGELVIEDAYGAQSVKLKAGSLVLYPATSLHRVNPITRGQRVASFFWVQSLVQDDFFRATLFDMDMAIQRLRADLKDDEHPSLIALTGAYHNLLRRWAIL